MVVITYNRKEQLNISNKLRLDFLFIILYRRLLVTRECVLRYFPNVLLDLAADLAAMVLVDSNKEVVGATGHISTRPVPR